MVQIVQKCEIISVPVYNSAIRVTVWKINFQFV